MSIFDRFDRFYHPDTSALERKLDQVLSALAILPALVRKVNDMSDSLDHLKASEAALIGKVDEAVVLLHALKAKVDELIAGGNVATAADLQALSDQADAALTRLGTEIAADALPA